MKPIRILLADDQPVVRAGLRALLEAQPDLQVVAEAGTGGAAVQKALELAPDVVFLNLSMPRGEGLEAAEQLLEAAPEIDVLVFAVPEERNELRQALRLGARGYLSRRADPEEMIEGLRVVARGGYFLDPHLSDEFLAGLSSPRGSNHRPVRVEPSDREREVLRLIALGFTIKEIAARLKVSAKTVETHKARAMEKMAFSSRVDIVRYARHQGWLQEV